jgi:hypothetical protein
MVTKHSKGFEIPRGGRSSSEGKISALSNPEIEASPHPFDIFGAKMSVKST